MAGKQEMRGINSHAVLLPLLLPYPPTLTPTLKRQFTLNLFKLVILYDCCCSSCSCLQLLHTLSVFLSLLIVFLPTVQFKISLSPQLGSGMVANNYRNILSLGRSSHHIIILPRLVFLNPRQTNKRHSSLWVACNMQISLKNTNKSEGFRPP